MWNRSGPLTNEDGVVPWIEILLRGGASPYDTYACIPIIDHPSHTSQRHDGGSSLNTFIMCSRDNPYLMRGSSYPAIGARWQRALDDYRRERLAVLACVHDYISVAVLATIVIDYAMW